MLDIIKKLDEKQTSLFRQVNVLTNIVHAYQNGLIRPKEEVLFYVKAINSIGGGQIKLEVPASMVGRKIRVILEEEEVQ